MGLDGMWEELRSYPVWRSTILEDPAASGLTFRHQAFYIQNRPTATPQSALFIYLVNKYII